MPFEQLLKSVSVLLAENGEFSVIIPFAEEERFIQIAKVFGLLVNRICRVRGTISTEIKRSLMSFSFRQKQIECKELSIEISRHRYTEDYIDLTQDFYINM